MFLRENRIMIDLKFLGIHVSDINNCSQDRTSNSFLGEKVVESLLR